MAGENGKLSTKRFSQKQLDAVQRQFNMMADKTSPEGALLDKKGTKFLFRSMGQIASESELDEWVDNYFKRVDGSQIEGLPFQGYLDFYVNHCRGLPPLSSVINVFHSFDPARTGYLKKPVLKKILQIGSTPFTDEEISQLFKTIDMIVPRNAEAAEDMSGTEAIDYVILAKS